MGAGEAVQTWHLLSNSPCLLLSLYNIASIKSQAGPRESERAADSTGAPQPELLVRVLSVDPESFYLDSRGPKPFVELLLARCLHAVFQIRCN